jgi:hypothetical protein
VRGEIDQRGSETTMADSWLDYFSAGVPTLFYVQMHFDDVLNLADKSTVGMGLDFTSELCMIGLAAYFEAFCKDHFAALINICPAVLEGFASKRDTRLAVKDLLHMISGLSEKLGFIVSEEYDFGSARSINSLYQDLLNITPFSKDEMKLYSEFLNDRNLLVHHGGVYTIEYARSKHIESGTKPTHGAHVESLIVNKDNVYRWAAFLVKMVTKIAGASASALTEFARMKNIIFNETQQEALDNCTHYDTRTRSGRMLEA